MTSSSRLPSRMTPDPSERAYPVAKIALVTEALLSEGVSASDALSDVPLSLDELRSPATRVSANHVLQSYRNAIKLSRDPQFACRAGLKFHVSTYGMYGFAMLSSPIFREAMAFAQNYHELATPLADIDFTECDGIAAWTIVPKSYPQIDAELYRFIVDLQMAVHLSLHRDLMGSAFQPLELRYSFSRADSVQAEAIFNCPILHGQAENRFAFAAQWLDDRPNLGNAVTYAELQQLCNRLLDELELSAGLTGRIRAIILADLTQTPNLASIAKQLGMSERSLRRKLQDESTSFRLINSNIRTQLATKYVRDTKLSVENIAYMLGFNDASAFRHAFRRWTGAAPHALRRAGAVKDRSAD
jgi:AraC-like DNA-binding protein